MSAVVVSDLKKTIVGVSVQLRQRAAVPKIQELASELHLEQQAVESMGVDERAAGA